MMEALIESFEKKRETEIDSKMNVQIDLQKGTATHQIDEMDQMFTYH